MSEAVEILEYPKAKRIDMIAGWRQWADAGAMSSGLPQYIIDQSKARKIGSIKPDGFYLFQIPGTHDLVRPVVQFDEGYPMSVESRSNDLYYSGDDQHGTLIFLGDEPHLDVERYTDAFLHLAEAFKVNRIIGFGGVYGELPYDKERMVSCSYSLPELKEEMEEFAVNFSDYHGGASIGSYLCRRAGERGIEFVGLYAFVPIYDFSKLSSIGSTLRIEDDYAAWLGVMRRVKYMLKLDFDLSDLERKNERLRGMMDAKIEELVNTAPQLGVREYLNELSAAFTEMSFNPLADVWEDEINRLLDEKDSDD